MGWRVLYTLLSLLELLIIGRVILSWVVGPASRHPVVVAVRSVTDAVLDPIRSVLPRTGMLDLSPMIAILIITLLRGMVSHLR